MQSVNNAEEFVPRAYQSEIFEKARDGNIICAMETGSGKTYIAVLLVKWLSTKPENIGKKIVFLVPKVPLVHQQTEVIKKHTPLRVKGYYGQLGVDAWDLNVWVTEFKEHDVLVMTAQIYYNVILHAYWSIKDTGLIIFDEAHHCQKNHVYAKIMSDHYKMTPSEDRPKILGLTASPIWNVKNPQAAIWNLEEAMDARIVAVTVNAEELDKNVARPAERIELYASPPERYPGYIRPTLWDECQDILVALWEDDYNARLGKYMAVTKAAGPYGADYWVLNELDSLIKAQTSGYDTAVVELSRRFSSPMEESESHNASYLEAAREAVERHRQRFSDEVIVKDSWLSPKMLKLVELLQQTKSCTDIFQGIIFTEQRSVAATVSWMLSRIPSLRSWIMSSVVMGHGTTSAPSAEKVLDGMQFKLQHEVIEKFRKHEINLLVATNVAEEGLDFKACHIIVRYDPLTTFVGYLQSRGRARRKDSEYIVMMEEHAYGDREMYERYKTAEPGLKRRYQSTITDPPSGLTPDDEDGLEDETTNNEVYEIASTGARLTAYASIGLLVYLCTLVPRDGYSRLLQPLWKEKRISERYYRYEVTLPSAIPVPSDERTYLGPVRRGKKSAKSSAAFLVMQRLLQREVFDNHLLPGVLRRGDSALDADGHGIVPISHLKPQIEVDSYDPFGNVHSDHATTLWIHPLYFDGIASTALITAVEVQPIDAKFPLMGGVAKEVISGKGTPHALSIAEAKRSDMDLLDQYFTKLLATAIAGQKLSRGTAPYFLAPLSPAGDIDWDLIRATLHSPTMNRMLGVPPDHLSPGLLVGLAHQFGRTFQVVRLRRDLSLSSAPEPNSRMKGFTSYLDYWTSHGFDLPENDTLVELRWLKKYQPTSTTLSRISDLADHFPTAGLQDPITIIPFSLCCTLRTSFPIFEAFRALPSILRHITDMYRVNLLQNRLQLGSIGRERLVEALTVPSSASQYSFQRLETLGDAVLKVITSVHVFNKFPFRHEGQLDIMKANSINNTYLLGRAWGFGLQRYLIHESAVAPRWRPASTVTHTDSEWISTNNRISRKCLPDVVEALLGVSYLKGGMAAAVNTATLFKLCAGGIVPWEGRDYNRGRSSERDGHTALLSPLEKQLGYTFRFTNLLLEALCHPTFKHDDTPSYQRLEFLGDGACVIVIDYKSFLTALAQNICSAVIDIYVTQYLFRKYPKATPGQITWAKSRSVCNPVLGTVSAWVLSLQKYMLADSLLLETAIDEYLEIVREVPYSRLVVETWAFDPPKPMADLLEAVIGAVLVDSNFSIDTVFRVIEPIMADVLAVVSPEMPRDPTTELMIWAARTASCSKIKYRKSASNPTNENARMDSISVIIHGIDVTSPVKDASISLSKCKASKLALAEIQNEDSKHHIARICDCRAVLQAKRSENERAKKAVKSTEGVAVEPGAGATPPEGKDQGMENVLRSLTKTTAVPAAVAPSPEVAQALHSHEETQPPSPHLSAASPAEEEQQEMQAFESLMKQPHDGDGMDFTEKGFWIRAKMAAELFDRYTTTTTSGTGDADDKSKESVAYTEPRSNPGTGAADADGVDDDDDSWAPW